MSDKKKHNMREKPCAVCGESDFTWGNLLVGTTDEHRSKVFFREFGMTFEEGDIPIYVRRCLTCGNVLMFLNDS